MIGNLITAFLISLIAAAVIYPFYINWIKKLQYGQHIREDGPTTHAGKAGTPTMGGVVFLAAAVIVSLLMMGRSLILYPLLLVIVGCGAIGFLDDYYKIIKKRSLGLKARSKLIGEIVITIFFILLIRQMGIYSSEISVPFSGLSFDLGFIYPLFVFAVISGASNAVNLTDGIDGLAAGTSFIALIAYIIIALQANLTEAALLSAALAGGCLGFLLYNRHPARIFMGDVGSLALGSTFAALALITKTELLLIIIGGVFVLETLSVIFQVISFQLTGHRVLLMAPLHHHFELKGWSEWKVVSIFWVTGIIFSIVGLAGYSN